MLTLRRHKEIGLLELYGQRKTIRKASTAWQPAEDGFTCTIEEIDRLTTIAATQKMAS